MTTIDPRTSDENVTNTRNDYYDLVSVLYHALESAKTYACYVQDATSCGDQELAQFFEECQQHEREHAERAKQLLAARAAQHTPSDNPTKQAPANPQPMTDEPRMDESLPDPTVWPARSFDE